MLRSSGWVNAVKPLPTISSLLRPTIWQKELFDCQGSCSRDRRRSCRPCCSRTRGGSAARCSRSASAAASSDATACSSTSLRTCSAALSALSSRNCHDSPRLAVKCERREGGADRDLAAVLAQELEAQVARHRSRARVPGELARCATRPSRYRDGTSISTAWPTSSSRGVAGQSLEAFVRLADHAVLVDEGDPIGQHLEQVVPGKGRILRSSSRWRPLIIGGHP